MINEFDNHNGFLVEKGEKVFDTGNRSFKYGDGIFETIKIASGKICNWENHHKRLLHGLNALKLDHGNYDADAWKREILKLIERNFYTHAKVRLFVYRDAPGTYTPMSNRIGYFIEGMRYDQPSYNFNKEGIAIGIYQEMKKQRDFTMNCKTTNALIYVMASIYKKEMSLDDVVILNDAGRVAETTVSNIFCLKKGKLSTPALSEAPVMGTKRFEVINIAKRLGFEIDEVEMTLSDLNEAEEIFVSNAMLGVQPVKAFDNQSKNIQIGLEFAEALEKSMLE